jgi:hypothetical protein
LALIASACGGGGGGGGHHEVSVTEDVGAAGGTVSTPDGKVALTIPPGALGNTEAITITEVDTSSLPPEFDGTDPVAAYELGPDRLQFQAPIALTLELDEQPLQSDGSLAASRCFC